MIFFPSTWFEMLRTLMSWVVREVKTHILKHLSSCNRQFNYYNSRNQSKLKYKKVFLIDYKKSSNKKNNQQKRITYLKTVKKKSGKLKKSYFFEKKNCISNKIENVLANF